MWSKSKIRLLFAFSIDNRPEQKVTSTPTKEADRRLKALLKKNLNHSELYILNVPAKLRCSVT